MSSFIMESAIYQEAKLLKLKDNREMRKAIFRATICSADEKNQNSRLYPHNVLEEAMQSCKPAMSKKAFLGELDHPFPQGNQAFDSIRQTTVSLKEVSHIIRDYEWRGNLLIGEMETSSTPNGHILLGLLKDKSGIGFSLRGLAELERQKDYNLVRGPMTLISFDSVSRPSHIQAVVNFNEMTFESQMLTESRNMVCVNGHCFLPDYFDKLVESKCINFFKKWV